MIVSSRRGRVPPPGPGYHPAVPPDASATVDWREYWNARYVEEPDRYGDDPNVFVREVVEGLPPGSALDVACGRGRNAVWLAARGHTVTAVDVSDVGLDHGRRLADERGVTVDWVHADVLEWRPDGTFDLVLLSYLQLPPATRPSAHSMAMGAVTGGGRLVLVAHHKHNAEHGIGGPDYPEVLYDEATVAGDFDELAVVRNEMVVRVVERGGTERAAYDLVFVGERQPS